MKHISSFLLGLTLAGALVACGGSNDAVVVQPAPAGTVTPTTPTTPAPAPAPAPTVPPVTTTPAPNADAAQPDDELDRIEQPAFGGDARVGLTEAGGDHERCRAVPRR